VRSRLAEILLQAGLINSMQLHSALARQRERGGRLLTHVVEMRLAREDQVVQAIATALKLPTAELDKIDADPKALAKIDPDFARTHLAFPYALLDSERSLSLAMADPTDPAVTDELLHRTGLRLKVAVAGERQIRSAIDLCYLGATDPRTDFRIFTPMEIATAEAPHPSALPIGSPADLARIEALRGQQERSARILRAVLELCLDKQLFKADDLHARLKKA